MANTRYPLNRRNTPSSQLISPLGIYDHDKDSLILVWFDPRSNARYDVQIAQKRLDHIISYIHFYHESSLCISFIKSFSTKRIFVVTSGLHASDILPFVCNLPQVHCIFVFCLIESKYDYLCTEYPKIVGIYVLLDALCISVRKHLLSIEQDNDIDNYDHDRNEQKSNDKDDDIRAFSFLDPDEELTPPLSKEVGEFLCFQLLKHLVLHQPRNETNMKPMIDLCREYYREDLVQQKLIDEFERDYQPSEAIRWYSKQSFLYKVINNALRKRDINQLYPFRFFIADLSHRLAFEHRKIPSQDQTLIFHRGMKLSSDELENFKRNVGKLVSSNGFLSTSRGRSQALSFARKSTQRTDTSTVRMEIQCHIQQLGERVIFADISPYSEFPGESEVLFDLSSVFQLESVEREGNMWFIRMNATDMGQMITEDYIERMRLDVEGLSVALILGITLGDMSEYDQAQRYFQQMLMDPNDEDLASIEFQIGRILELKGNWREALRYYNRAYEQMMNTSPARLNDSTQVLNNLGNIFTYEEKYDKALEIFRRALSIQEQHHPKQDNRTAVTLNNIGNILTFQDKYAEALDLHQEALAIQEKSKPVDDMAVAATLTKIGDTLFCQEKYKQALEYHRRALKIKEKSSLSEPIKLAISYSGIGAALQGQRKYDEAIDYHRRALKIQEECYPSGHIDTANSLNSIAAILRAQKKYDEALELLKRALKIKEECYPSRHVDIATTLNNIGLIYEDKGDYDRAIQYHEKALYMKEGLTGDHPSIGISYGNLASVYSKTGRYDLALDCKQKYLLNRQKFLPPNHSTIGDCHSSIGDTYVQMQERNKALNSYKKALAIYEKNLPVGHPAREKTKANIQQVSDSKCSLQ